MSEIWFTADYHLNHPKSVSWRPRFSSVEEMNETIIEEHNAIVGPTDTVYILGDIAMGSAAEAPQLVSRLNGHKHLMIGNHDTDAKLKLYAEQNLFKEILWATQVKFSKRPFFMCHYPMFVENHTENPTWVLHGHTHSSEPFSDHAQNIHVGYETSNLPLNLDDIRLLILNFQ